jgi:hypothetical protein
MQLGLGALRAAVGVPVRWRWRWAAERLLPAACSDRAATASLVRAHRSTNERPHGDPSSPLAPGAPQTLLTEGAARLMLPVNVIRKTRSVGVVPAGQTIYEVLEDLAITVQSNLVSALPFCAFNVSAPPRRAQRRVCPGQTWTRVQAWHSTPLSPGLPAGRCWCEKLLHQSCALSNPKGGNDVFVDIGNKCIGLEALLRYTGAQKSEVRRGGLAA